MMGRFGNSHKIFLEFLNDSPTVSQQTGYVSQGWYRGYIGGGCPWGMPGMSDTPNEFIFQSLDCCNADIGEL